MFLFVRGGGEKGGVTWQLALADLTGWFNRMFGESGRGRGGWIVLWDGGGEGVEDWLREFRKGREWQGGLEDWEGGCQGGDWGTRLRLI